MVKPKVLQSVRKLETCVKPVPKSILLKGIPFTSLPNTLLLQILITAVKKFISTDCWSTYKAQ